jgi:hypothetical protein
MTQTEQARTGNANRSRDEALDYRVLNLASIRILQQHAASRG